MLEIRTMAIESLDLIVSPLTKVCLGRKYDYLPWIKEGFIALCLRREPLTEEEGSQLGFKCSLKCAAARERIRAQVMQLSDTVALVQTKFGGYLVRKGEYDDGQRYLTSKSPFIMIFV
jgi:hypothetical protein